MVAQPDSCNRGLGGGNKMLKKIGGILLAILGGLVAIVTLKGRAKGNPQKEAKDGLKRIEKEGEEKRKDFEKETKEIEKIKDTKEKLDKLSEGL